MQVAAKAALKGQTWGSEGNTHLTSQMNCTSTDIQCGDVCHSQTVLIFSLSDSIQIPNNQIKEPHYGFENLPDPIQQWVKENFLHTVLTKDESRIHLFTSFAVSLQIKFLFPHL